MIWPKHEAPKSRKRSTQNSKTKHPGIENEAPKLENETPKSRNYCRLKIVLEPIPYAIYWGYRGFWKARHNFYAADGVHLNGKGQYKLYRSFRGAVLMSMWLFSSVDIQ